jgi:hypothetical protein
LQGQTGAAIARFWRLYRGSIDSLAPCRLAGRNTAAALLHRVDRSGAGRLLLF